MKKLTFIALTIFVIMTIGEIRCIYKAVNCNWEPIGKAEVIYTTSALTGVGVVVGFINIEDN